MGRLVIHPGLLFGNVCHEDAATVKRMRMPVRTQKHCDVFRTSTDARFQHLGGCKAYFRLAGAVIVDSTCTVWIQISKLLKVV
jgi:hypothetical protein